MQETWVWSLGQEDPLEKENGNPLQYPWEIPWKKRSLVGYSPWGCKDLDTTEHGTVLMLTLDTNTSGAAAA